MTSKISIYLIPILFSAIFFYSFSTTGNSFNEANSNASKTGTSLNSGTGANVLILVHDSTTTSVKRTADRDTLRRYLPAVVGTYTLMTFDTTTVLPDLTPYDFIILQETSFDDALRRYLGVGARNQIKAWLATGTPLSKKRLLSIGADQSYNYSRSGSGGRDLDFSDNFGKFIYRVDNGSGNTSPSITGINIDVGMTRILTSSPAGAAYYPDGASMSAGGTALYRYQNHTASDTLAAIGNNTAAGYVVGTLFVDPRYFTGNFGVVFEQMVLWVNENVPLPVELTSFTSTVSGNDVTLNWITASELNNAGFDIERYSVQGNEWAKIGNVEGNGTTTQSSSYSYTDKALATGSYNYRLKQIDVNGNFEYYNLNNEVNIGAPQSYSLSQNYPNPFNPSTTIEFALPQDGFAAIYIYDMSGKEVAKLVNEFKSAGFYTINFDGSKLASGNYFYRLESGNYVQVKKMILVK